MEVVELSLSGLKLVKPRVFGDERGFFLETFRAERYAAAGMAVEFVQDNHSRSVRGTLRGLHYQSSPGQTKLLRVVSGKIFDVAVDIRPASPTFGAWEGVYLDAEDHHQLFVPIGFAHGFCVVSETADVLYKVSSPYDASTECTLRWNDPDIGVVWPVDSPVLSARDQVGEPLAELARRMGR
jgi:dTDP-4-dehydrorhamnose 3,5-epimerase